MNKPKINKISETLFEVLGHSVKIQKKAGRTLLLCTCTNHTKFCLENPWCYHKQLVIKSIILEPFEKRINKLIKEYSGYKEIKAKILVWSILEDLIKLKKELK